MDPFEGVIFEHPGNDPTIYCRLCLSKGQVRLLSSASEPLNLVQLIRKQLDIKLTEPDDFPCAVCTICVQKLEELFESNDDGLLNEWDDDGLLEYKEACQAVNKAIKNWRCAADTVPVDHKTIVLPFQQLGDGRYKCKECPDLVFDDISVCLTHHQESHLNASVKSSSTEGNDPLIILSKTHSVTKRTNVELAEITTNGKDRLNSEGSITSNSAINGSTEKKRPCFKCVSCSESFDNIDNLIQHRSIHEKTKNPKHRHHGKRKRLMIEGNDTKCKECNVKFPNRKAFYVHLNAIHDLNICYICDESFSSGSLLVRHQSYHRNLNDIINPFLLGKHSFHCNVCFEKFRTEKDIRLHYQMQHTESENGSESNGTSNVVFSASTDRSTN